MTRRWPPILFLIISLLGLTVVILLVLQIRNPPERSLRPPASADTQPYWVMALNVAREQHTTAYTESPGSRPSASGHHYFVGSVAVHPEVPVSGGGDPLDPIIPFGTTIHLIDPPGITIHGNKYSSFKVIDTGDVNWSLRGESPYWIDLYYGPTSRSSYQDAAEHGVGTVDYYWFHVVDRKGPIPVKDQASVTTDSQGKRVNQ